MRTCDRRDCRSGQAGNRMPVLLVWASIGKRHDPARMELTGLAVCPPCAAAATPADFLSEDGKDQIEQIFAARGLAAPLWSTAALDWRETA